MPKYSSGEDAKIGDIVIGQGRHSKVPIAGVVVAVGGQGQDIRVAHIRPAVITQPGNPMEEGKPTGCVIEHGLGLVVVSDSVPLTIGNEYGDAGGFRKL